MKIYYAPNKFKIKNDFFESLYDYKKVAKIDDRIVLGGCGLVDGLDSIFSKFGIYKVCKIDEKDIYLKSYGSNIIKPIDIRFYNQKVALLTKEDFENLPYPKK